MRGPCVTSFVRGHSTSTVKGTRVYYYFHAMGVIDTEKSLHPIKCEGTIDTVRRRKVNASRGCGGVMCPSLLLCAEHLQPGNLGILSHHRYTEGITVYHDVKHTEPTAVSFPGLLS